MKKLPCLLYRSPGTHVMPGLNAPTYDYIGVSTPEDYEHRIANGWHPTRDEAFGKTVAPSADRAELEAKARELGIGFNWKTTDAALAERIAGAEK